MEAFRPGSKRNQVQRLDLAGSGFLRLLRVLRTVILQDSVGLRQLFPEHPIWKADVFASEVYQAFAAKTAAASESGEGPEDLQIKKALPILYDRMSMLREDVKQSIKQEAKTMFSEIKTVSSEINELTGAVLDFTTGKKSFTVFANSENPRTSIPPPLLQSHGAAVIPPGAEDSQSRSRKLEPSSAGARGPSRLGQRSGILAGRPGGCVCILRRHSPALGRDDGSVAQHSRAGSAKIH
jgi:hypothetical protein